MPATSSTTTSSSTSSSTDILETILARFSQLEETVRTLAVRVDEARPTSFNPSTIIHPSSAEPVRIPQPPSVAQVNRSTATCKPPKEPSLTGDKQLEWQEFEREFLRYFRITHGYYLDPEVQVDLLLATAGDKVRRVFYQLALPAEDTIDLEKVIIAIRQAFSQQQSTVVNKYLFMKIRREAGEDLDTFVTRLRESARRCAFADEDQRVLEQLIFSTIDNVEVLKRMVKDSPPTLSEVIRILKADEIATLELDRMVGRGACVHAVTNEKRHVKNNVNTSNTVRGQSRPTLSRGGSCDNCIFSHESRDQCPAKAMECFFCKKTGHMIAKCRKRIAANREAKHGISTRRLEHRNVHEVEQVVDTDESDTESVAVDSIFVGSLSSEDKDSWKTAIRIGNKLVNCKIDTGAEVNVMPQRVYNQLRDKPSLESTKTVLRTVAGQIKPLGVIEASIQYKSRKSTARFFVVEDSTPTLCGLQTSVELGLVKKLFH